MSKTDVSIIIPCFQEENHILENVRRINQVMHASGFSFELIFVEDASTDTTREKILQIAKEFPNVHYVFHEKNIGKGGSVSDGVKIANGRFIGHIDIDLEVSAEYIPALLSELEKGSDVVLVNRKVKFSVTPKYFLRDAAGMLHRRVLQLFLGIPHTDVQSGCKFFRREALLPLLEKIGSTGWFFDAELMARAYDANLRIRQIPGYYIRSQKKRSTVNLFSDGIEQLGNLIKFAGKLRKERK